MKSAGEGKKKDVRCQKSGEQEGRNQKSDVRNQKSDVRNQKSEVRDQGAGKREKCFIST